MRLFVAINLPHEERLRLYSATAPLRRIPSSVRWVAPETLHLTMKFLGEMPAARLPQLQHALQRAAFAHDPFDLELAGIGVFPNLSRPRVYWVGTEGARGLEQLHTSVEDEFARLGFAPEARAFHPHLTIGRVKVPLALAEAEALAKAAEGVSYHAAVPITTIDLMRSHTTANCPRYEPLGRFVLGG